MCCVGVGVGVGAGVCVCVCMVCEGGRQRAEGHKNRPLVKVTMVRLNK